MSDIRIVKILIASPSDVAKEREMAEEVINEWNICNSDACHLKLEAVLWETHAAPDSSDRTQIIINHQIVDTCDFAIGIFWTKIGTPTDVAPGGAVEEVERLMAMGKPVMFYFSDVPIARKDVDKEQEAKLDIFRASMQSVLCEKYETHADFRSKLVRQLAINVRKWFCPSEEVPLLDKPYPEDANRYQLTLKEELGFIRMLGMPGVESIKVNLNDDTFVPLRLSDRQEHDNPVEGKRSFESNEHILNPDEIMNQAFHDRRKRRMLLVIGDPGAGKTTLLKYYALCAVEEFTRLGFKAPLNVFYLPLRDLLRDKDGNYTDALSANLANWSKKHQLTIENQTFEEWLHGGTSLVLLDGLDEISNTAERIKACQWIDFAFTGFSKAFFVVTSRFTGYNKEEGVELESDYERADVQDFTADQQERFLRNWFTAAFLKEPCEEGVDKILWQKKQKAKAEERTSAIMAHLTVEKNKGLRQLAAIPMILQIMAILWKDRDYMPENRVELYDAALNYLLEFRDKRRGIKPLLSAIDARQVLAPVSLWMQESLNKDEAGKKEMHTAMHEWLDTLDTPPSPEAFCDYLVKRAGLFVESGAKEYLFRHKSFREYLAGVQLKEDRPYDQLGKLVSHFGEEWWEEPLRFFIGSVDGNLFDAFMQKLLDSPISESLTAKQQLLLQTLIAEAKGKKVDALCKKLLDPANTASRQRVMLDCLKAIGKSSVLQTLEQFRALKIAKDKDVTGRTDEVIRAFGGEVAKGTIRSILNPHEHNAEYILIRGGSYIYSLTEKVESVPDLYVAKYPVTNKLYRSFISALGEASGFREKLNEIATKKIWDTGFSEYLKGGKGDLPTLFRSSFDEDRKFGGDNQPVVGVTWYAAQAYALWLSQLEGKTCRLPTGIEWEWAAAGRQGTTGMEVRKYPWADETREPDSKLLNFDGNVGATTPVGSYPEGATPEGLYDMAGNVWEWTEEWHNVFGSYRVLRGGSWDDDAGYCRSAYRGGGPPDGRLSGIGFRLVLVP
ncbi:MAG: SUMF1/EgtB/PvdO family nonheme iron enzyme [Chlorobium sp.]